jgi:hypothetical protein
MKRLVPTLTAVVFAVAATMALPSVGSALEGDELQCAGGTAQDGVEYTQTISPKLNDACLDNDLAVCDPDEADIDGDHDDFVAEIEESCADLPEAFEGFCDGTVPEIAECIADAYDAGAVMVADSRVGGGTPEPETLIIREAVVLHCSRPGQPCTGPGITGCCGGLTCKVRSASQGGQTVFRSVCARSGYSSTARAFIDKTNSLLR